MSMSPWPSDGGLERRAQLAVARRRGDDRDRAGVEDRAHDGGIGVVVDDDDVACRASAAPRSAMPADARGRRRARRRRGSATSGAGEAAVDRVAGAAITISATIARPLQHATHVLEAGGVRPDEAQILPVNYTPFASLATLQRNGATFGRRSRPCSPTPHDWRHGDQDPALPRLPAPRDRLERLQRPARAGVRPPGPRGPSPQPGTAFHGASVGRRGRRLGRRRAARRAAARSRADHRLPARHRPAAAGLRPRPLRGLRREDVPRVHRRGARGVRRAQRRRGPRGRRARRAPTSRWPTTS